MKLEVLSIIYYYMLISIAAYFFAMSLLNFWDIRRKTVLPKIKSGFFVSVLVPARNEEKNIEQCILSLCNQDYKNYEILVMDDHSTDNTYNILLNISNKYSRLKVYQSAPLENGWFGKPFALQQLSEFAKGDIFLLTDADTIHKKTSISWAVTNLESSNSDFISGYAGQILKTLGERITVPVMFFLTGFVIPMFLNKNIKSGFFSAAVGQYIVIKRDVFIKTGGYNMIRMKTSEDIYMARHIKGQGYKTDFLDMSNQVKCRMYESYFAAIQGIGKNISDFIGKRTSILVGITMTVFLFFFLPFPLLVYGIAVQSPFLMHLITANMLFTFAWLMLFIMQKIRWYNAFLWPLLYCDLFCMVLWSFYRTVSGKGFLWKGRTVS